MKTYKKIVFIFLVCLYMVLVPFSVSAQDSDREQEVRSAFSRFSAAFQSADIATLDNLLTENYRHVNGSSGNVINKDQWLAWLASRGAEIQNGDFSYEDYEVEDLQVELYGDMAVVIGVARANGVRNGEPFTMALAFTNVWVKQNGDWRRAAFHDSSLPGA